MSHTIRSAAEVVLQEAGEPLHYREITRRALARKLITSQGKKPEGSLYARLAIDLLRRRGESKFVKTAPGVFALRSWRDREDVEASAGTTDDDLRMRVPYYPIYSRTASLMPVIDGCSKQDVLRLKSDVIDRRGTPQDQTDWSDPDAWIPERLEGRSAQLAEEIWSSTNGTVNPRYLAGHWALIVRYELLEVDRSDMLRLSERGQDFLEDPEGPTVQELDFREGLDRALGLVAELGPASRADLLPPFSDFAREHSKLRAESSIKSFLWSRLRNLTARGLIERVGRSYSATADGLGWLATLGEDDSQEQRQENDLMHLISERRQQVREEIRDRLIKMDPYAFEHLVKMLLEAMEYEDVEVTSKSGDGGVDVTARIQLGITEVTEVVQVKRHARNIQRTVMDALRGSLHRFNAVRGTIITTGGFARGTKEAAFESGAAPITLIDGERLIDLMLDHEIGVQKRRVELLEIEPSAFLIEDEEEAD